MAKSVDRIIKGFTAVMDMPSDVLMDMPRIRMMGNVELVVENHKGLLEYTPKTIRLRTKTGILIIHGRRLRILFFVKDELKLDGHIVSVAFSEH